MIQAALPDYALQLAEMQSSLQELKNFVRSWGWTYAVIWKIGPDHRTPVWHESYFNELAETEVGQAQRFENIYKRCQFTPNRPGYAYLAWQRQSPFWWTRQLMEPVPTDENKELFLRQAGIQTLVCFPGRAPAGSSGYCVELASTSPVSETEYFKNSIQDFISTSIAPHISSTSPLLQEIPASVTEDVLTSISPAAAMAAVAHQDSIILTDITNQASIGEDEAIEGFGNIVRAEEPYYPWTMSGSLSVSAGMSNYPNFDDLSNYNPNFDLSFNYAGSSPILGPFHELEGVSVGETQLVPGTDQWTTSSGTGSRKGKEIIVEESDLGITGQQTSLKLPNSQNFSLLQQEALEKLRSRPALAPSLPSAQNSQMIIPFGSSGYRPSISLRPIGQMLPGHSPRSLFQPHRHAQFPRFGASKRPSLIYKWATTLALEIVKIKGGLQGPGGERQLAGWDNLDGSPGTHIFDPRSPNSLAHDHLAAETHKIAERKRRSKMNNKLRTLISIVPIIDKKDKVSVLTSTIEYIRQLTSQISYFEKVEEAAPTTLRMEEGTMMSMDREEELALFSNIEGAGPSSSSSTRGPIVVVEGSPEGETWVIKVEASNHSRSFIQLLNVLQELDLGVITMDYGAMNGRFRANISVKISRNLSRSSSELQATLCRVLETGDSSTTGSD